MGTGSTTTPQIKAVVVLKRGEHAIVESRASKRPQSILRWAPITATTSVLDDGTAEAAETLNVMTCANWASLQLACVHQYIAAPAGPESVNACEK